MRPIADAAAQRTWTRAQPWFGTMVTVSVRARRADTAHAAIDAAFATCAAIHRAASAHDPRSDIARIARARPGQGLRVDAHVVRLLRLAKHWHAATGGTFDPAVGARLARTGQRAGLLAASAPEPAAGQIAAGVADGTLADVSITGLDTLVVARPAALDLGGIAKGYAVDRAVDALRAVGIESAMVNAGGDLRCFGPFAWPVAQRVPGSPTRLRTWGRWRDAAIATSGVYLSGGRIGARPASDLVRPGRGRLAVAARGCTVVARDAATADVLAKVVLLRHVLPRRLLAAHGARAWLH